MKQNKPEEKYMYKIGEFTVTNERYSEFGGEGFACGPVGIDGFEVEIEIEEDGRKLYFQGEWISEGDGFYFAVRYTSVYDELVRFDDVPDEIIDIIQNPIEDFHNIEESEDSKYYAIYRRINEILEENVELEEDEDEE